MTTSGLADHCATLCSNDRWAADGEAADGSAGKSSSSDAMSSKVIGSPKIDSDSEDDSFSFGNKGLFLCTT